MPALTPQQVHEQFTEAFLAHDLDGVMALYDADALLAPLSGGRPVRGKDAIREVIAALLAMKPRDGGLETVFCLERDNLALMRSKWHFTGDGPNGIPVEMVRSGTEVMHRNADGTWVHLIDSPRGGDPL